MLTNDELKKKIVDVLIKVDEYVRNEIIKATEEHKAFLTGDNQYYYIVADALIAAGLTFDDEWKHKVEVAKQLNKTYDAVKLEKRNGEPYEIICTHCGENIRYYVSAACMYCGAKLTKTQKEIKDKFTDILQLKAFCDKQGIKCILTRRNEYVKCQDGYKIQFLNGDVIQGTDTYSYLEFDGTSKDIDNKRISLKEAKTFVAKNKNWLSMQAEKELAEERKDD